MTNRQQTLKNIVLDAIEEFNNNESFLIKNDLSERCICSKFALYLEKKIKQSIYSDYYVDVEYNRGYNRDAYQPKTLYNRKIVVDLVVHKRKYDGNYGFQNLICIEMKKEYSNKGIDNDRLRLQTFTNNQYGFCYSVGFMIVAYRNKREDLFGLKIDSEYYNENDDTLVL